MHQLAEGDASGIPKPVVPMDQEHIEVMSGEAFGGDTVKFSTEAPAQEAVLPGRVDLTKLSVAPETALLQNFLRRPVNIHTEEWDVASASFHIDPWALFLNTQSVKEKMGGYKFARGTLHLDIQINGTPFHYGRCLVSYEPANNLRRSFDGDFRQHSCLPHVMLDPAVNTVGKFDCPFIHPEMWMDLTSAFGAKLGVLNFDFVAELAVFEGGAADPVTIQTYAWIEDLELSFPTQKAMAAFEPQAKKVKKANNGNSRSDEYEVNPNAGLISKPAAMLADVAGRLSTVPVIGQFATATQIGAGAISKIAALFGYSRPKDLTATDVFLARPTGYMATCDTADQTVALTVNSKSELTIDPSAVGLNLAEDELAIKSIASKWTLGNVFEWTRTDNPETIIMRDSVSPTMGCKYEFGAVPRIDQTACGYAALPFRAWHGSMEIRVQVICSKFHRGRLRFQWTPEDSLSQNIQLGYNHVVDICDSQEYHLKLPYAGGQGFKRIEEPVEYDGSTFFSDQKHSGRIKIIVQNKLVCPSDEPVRILVWYRGGDDLVFANPDFDWVGRVTSAPPVPPTPPAKGAKPPVKIHKTVEDLEEQSGITDEWESEEIITFFDDAIHPDYDLTFYADPVRSFRPLLKRYQLTTSLCNVEGITPNQYKQFGYYIPLYPQMAGYVPNGSWQRQDGNVPINCTRSHLANYLGWAFLAKKGGFRHIVDASHGLNAQHTIRTSNLTVQRVTNQAFRGIFSSNSNSIGDTVARGPRYSTVSLGFRSGANQRRYLDDSMPGGGQLFGHHDSDGRVAYEIPFYHDYRYVTHLGDQEVEQEVQKNPFDTSDQAAVVKYSIIPTVTGENLDIHPNFKVYSAAAEDFTMHFFLGPPQIYLNSLPTAPTDYNEVWVKDPFVQQF